MVPIEGVEVGGVGSRFTVSYNLLVQLTSPASDRLAIMQLK